MIYPNPVLKKISKEVTLFDETLHALLDDMYETMIAENGVGLAAIQVGVDMRALVINIPREDEIQYKEDTLEMINPVILKKEGIEVYKEGCLSVPEYYDEIERAEIVSVAFQDRYGQKQTLEVVGGLLAIAIQHEMDHLEGHLFVERLPMLKRKKFEKEWKKRARENKKF
jgi:peptide deformylase